MRSELHPLAHSDISESLTITSVRVGPNSPRSSILSYGRILTKPSILLKGMQSASVIYAE
jgi:hypothetical protein